MSDIPIQRQVRTAHKRRARLIAQMHRQAMEAADELLTQHHAIEEGLNKLLSMLDAEGSQLSQVLWSWHWAA
jgi:hypothetical protein